MNTTVATRHYGSVSWSAGLGICVQSETCSDAHVAVQVPSGYRSV